MCGLIGIINREPAKVKSDNLIKFFREGLYADALRGVHGTGILGVESNGDQAMYKKSLSAADFIDLTKAKSIMNDNNVFLLGHNRFATQGGHTCENAHPFKHHSVTLFHNGTLNSWKWMAANEKFTVDSECLAYYISQSTNIVDTLNQIDGAYSLVWYDSSNKTLNFARNDERPMFFGLIKNTESFVYASESGMINWLASRNGIELTKIITTDIGKLITIPLDAKEKVRYTPFTPKVVDKWDYYKGYNSSYIPKTSYYTPKKTKNSHLLEKKTIIVQAVKWEPYSATSTNGRLTCTYDNLNVVISSVSPEHAHVIMDKDLLVKVDSCPNDIDVFCTYLRIATDDDILEEDNKELELLRLELLAEEIEERKADNLKKTQLSIVKKYEGKGNRLLSEAEFLEATEDGCMACKNEILPTDHRDISWDEEGSPVCADCAIVYAEYLK